MVNIKANTDTLEIWIDGHARSVIAGNDLVCCAVSILVETLCVYMELQEREGRLAGLKIEHEAGHVYINPQPYGWSRRDIETAFNVIVTGLQGLEHTYSKNIRMEVE